MMLALTLVAAACGGDDEIADPDEGVLVTTPTQPVATAAPEPGPVTTPTAPPETVPELPDPIPPEVEITIEPDPDVPAPGTEVAPPTPPSNVACKAGNSEGELFVEWDALPAPSEISKIRVYVSEDGGPFIYNGEFTMAEVDTSRNGGTRWAAPARRLPVGVPLRLTATSFNLLGQESGWYIVNGVYTGPGQPCADPAFTAPTCTAGCDEQGE